MPNFVYANNVSTTLANPITTTSQTSITLSSSANLPTLSAGQTFALTLNDQATQSVFEVVYVTAISGATLTVTRGQEGTAATTWLAGDYAYGAVTAGILDSFAASGAAGVSSVNGETGALTVSSADSSIVVGGSGSTINLQVSASAVAVGACVAAHATFTTPSSQLPITVTLPTLPVSGSTWYLECFSIGVDFSGSGSGQNATLTGGGSGVTWYGNSYYQQPAYTRTLMIVGQAAGGQAPSVTLTANGSLILVPNSTAGYVTIKAIRVS